MDLFCNSFLHFLRDQLFRFFSIRFVCLCILEFSQLCKTLLFSCSCFCFKTFFFKTFSFKTHFFFSDLCFRSKLIIVLAHFFELGTCLDIDLVVCQLDCESRIFASLADRK